MSPRHPTMTLFPYTTLFRSPHAVGRRTTAPRLRAPVPAQTRHRGDGRGDLGARRRQLGELSHQHRLAVGVRSEEHTSELQSLRHLVCRLLLEKKKKNTNNIR